MGEVGWLKQESGKGRPLVQYTTHHNTNCVTGYIRY